MKHAPPLLRNEVWPLLMSRWQVLGRFDARRLPTEIVCFIDLRDLKVSIGRSSLHQHCQKTSTTTKLHKGGLSAHWHIAATNATTESSVDQRDNTPKKVRRGTQGDEDSFTTQHKTDFGYRPPTTGESTAQYLRLTPCSPFGVMVSLR
jgi:hypothetical protein